MDKLAPLTALLTQDNSATGRVLKRCHTLRQLDQHLASLLAPELRQHCHLGNVRGNSVVVYCDSAAWLARLRYQLAQLLESLRQHPSLARIEQLELKVTPTQRPRTLLRDAPVLSEHAATCLNDCADMVSDQSLRDALTRLARHHKTR